MNDTASTSTHVTSWWKFWENPLIVRYQRSRLRLRRSIGWILSVIVFSSFLFFTTYLTAVNRELASPLEAARGVFLPILVIQGVLLMLMGTGSVASGIVQDKISGTIDYQRLTPMTPLTKIVGYLLGLPIREYLLLALTLPFVIFSIWVGKIPIQVWAPVYTIFLTSALLYHLTGMAAGMIAKKWKYAARLTQGLVILLYLVLPQFSHLGLYAFQYLTVRPVMMGKLMPLLPHSVSGATNPLMESAQTVPFFIWEFSSFTFSLILQALLIVTLCVMCHRKWRDERQHALSKPYGAGIFGVVVLMILGNLWPILTRDTSVNLPILGGMSADRIDQGVSIALPIVLSLALVTVAIAVLHMVTPTYHEVLKGWRRVLKQGRSHLGMAENEAPSGPLVLYIGAVSVFAIVLEIALLNHHGFYEGDSLSPLNYVYLPLAFCIALASFYASLIGLQTRRIFLVLLLGWVLPGLIAVFMGAAFSSYNLSVYLSALSPLFLIVYGAGFMMPNEMVTGDEFSLSTVHAAFWVSSVFHIAWISGIGFRWHRQYQSLVALAKSGSKEVPKSLLETDDD